MSFPPNA
ncbi:hypothetical protein ECPA32_5780, partial [Escherichia coli PA32]